MRSNKFVAGFNKTSGIVPRVGLGTALNVGMEGFGAIGTAKQYGAKMKNARNRGLINVPQAP